MLPAPTMEIMDAQQFGDFLRRSRDRLRPEDVGLDRGPRRRAPGLRRQELARVAGISPDYLMRPEQARNPQPSSYPHRMRAETSRMHTADFRAATVRRGDVPASRALIDDLHDASGEFARLWERHEVASRSSSRMYLRHPLLGEIGLDVEPLLTPAEDQRMHIFTPPREGAGHAVLAMLGDLDPATSHPSHRTGPNTPMSHGEPRYDHVR